MRELRRIPIRVLNPSVEPGSLKNKILSATLVTCRLMIPTQAAGPKIYPQKICQIFWKKNPDYLFSKISYIYLPFCAFNQF